MIRDPIKHHDAVLLSNHGTLTVGRTLEEALIALERIESTAQLYFLAHNLGDIIPLPEKEIKRLKSIQSG